MGVSSFLLQIYCLIPWRQKIKCGMTFYSFNFVKMYFMAQNITLLMSLTYLRKTCILLLLDDMVCRCPICPVDWWYCWSQLHLDYNIVLVGFSHFRYEVFQSPTTVRDSSVYPCASFSLCLLYFDTLLLGTYMLKIVLLVISNKLL